MPTVAEKILSEAKALPEGALISAKEFLHLGSRAAVDQAIKRLKERKELMLLFRELTCGPSRRDLECGPRREKVVEGIAATRAETVVAHGAAAANFLGLTTQVPTKLVFLTSGKNRRIKLGAQVIEMKHAPPWMLLPSHRPGSRARTCMDRGASRSGSADNT